MEIKQEELLEIEEISWDRYDSMGSGSGSKYFKPEVNREYRLTFFSVRPILNKKFMDKDGKPKRQLVFSLDTIDGKPAPPEQVWTTGSYDIRNEVEKYRMNILNYIFILRKKEKEGKTSYDFLKIGERTPPAPKQDPFV